MEIDPLDWTVDEVVAFLCHSSSTPWLQSANPLQLLDPVSFEAALRENLVNGEVLLNDVEGVSLREDLGLKAFGHRSMVLAAIRYLRQLSVKYQKTAIIQGKLFLLMLLPVASSGNMMGRTNASSAQKFVDQARSSLAKPSQFQSRTSGLVNCSHPFDYDSLPITLLQEEFANFKDDCAQEPSIVVVQLLEDLTVPMVRPRRCSSRRTGRHHPQHD
ncbi:hypothetical protein V8E54_013720 [Elaphomyces granulatus]